MYRRSSESRMRSGTCRAVSKWSRHKELYIGSLCLDIGCIPGEIRILPEYREGYRNPPGAKWANMGLGGEVRGLPSWAARLPLPLVLLGLGEVGAPPLSLF